ncbi:hypothetical protein Htur_5014 (plasmid) [Haloterrigena turkmenica DSM 5511]|uniref:Methyltransferase FkbM family n=1 Tax=Haloterrigena turkmenica (strain ATCC 51198 / DSM 5511 / JCM 9101 / NCIMB 13204 / VKM B-1734 / 4k) TaxID=543526 RepID=D2S3F5_HALTV|nr:hypothetical protein [Haloterrigena turkmenica]ADB63902.1 hypothetical protein Htur_5014 [Haloterrigena turkmenica DSM 5511]
MLDLVRGFYDNTLRDILPKKYRVFAGVAVYDGPILDITSTKSYYKEGLLTAITEHVNEGDEVELVGFGRGVSTVYALSAGAAKVTAHEAAAEMIEIGKHTVDVNRTGDGKLEVRHSIVGEGIDIYGDGKQAEPIPPSELSFADILVLDCEGAEKSILSGLGNQPETIICETHPEKGVPAEDTIAAIGEGYQITTRAYEPDNDTPEGKVVVIATRESSNWIRRR